MKLTRNHTCWFIAFAALIIVRNDIVGVFTALSQLIKGVASITFTALLAAGIIHCVRHPEIVNKAAASLRSTFNPRRLLIDQDEAL